MLHFGLKQIADRFNTIQGKKKKLVSPMRIKLWIKEYCFPAARSDGGAYIAHEELIKMWEDLYYIYKNGGMSKKEFNNRVKNGIEQKRNSILKN